MKSRLIIAVSGAILCLFATGALADISLDEAKKIGEENLKRLIDQSYHYRVEYDTVIVLPVYSRTVWKNDFYLLYFLKDDYFQVEMEVDGKTGKPTILAMGAMSPPYHELYTGTFNHRYFNADSVVHYMSLRRRLSQDSARLVYYGVIPELGKRGVVWELYSSEGIHYVSMGGPSLTAGQLTEELNLAQRKMGNFVADSIRMEEIVLELDRLETLSHNAKQELGLYPATYDSVVNTLMEERGTILLRFPVLRRYFPLAEDSLLKNLGKDKSNKAGDQ
jgi:hypothetical protein